MVDHWVLPKILSLVSIVLLLLWMFYFMAGSLPLLILKYDDPSDSQLVRGFFHVHYSVLMGVAAVGTISAAFSNRTILAAAIACIAIFGFFARRLIVSRMDQLRGTMTPTDTPAIRMFKRLHITGLVLNAFVLAGFFSVLNFSSGEIFSCAEPPQACQGEGCRVVCSLL